MGLIMYIFSIICAVILCIFLIDSLMLELKNVLNELEERKKK